MFDFFGTLVEYEPCWAHLVYPRSHQLLESWGYALSHEAFVAEWDSALVGLERTVAESYREFSMLDAAGAFCQVSDINLSPSECEQLVSTVVAEWQQHVSPVPGVSEMIKRLSEHTRLGIASNTHDPHLVPAMLVAMGIADRFEATVLSVDHGHRKPHPSIYEAALDRMGVDAARVVFVGDSHDADYVGPKRAGMAALLIDRHAQHDVAFTERLSSVLDVEDRVRELTSLA